MIDTTHIATDAEEQAITDAFLVHANKVAQLLKTLGYEDVTAEVLDYDVDVHANFGRNTTGRTLKAAQKRAQIAAQLTAEFGWKVTRSEKRGDWIMEGDDVIVGISSHMNSFIVYFMIA